MRLGTLWQLGALAAVCLCTAGLSTPASAGGAGAESSPPETVGLGAEPGGLLIQGITPGEVCDLAERAGIWLTIHNRGRIAHTYVLSSHRPSEIGNRRVPTGYRDIPDPSWFWFEQNEVRVDGQSSAQVRMYIGVPDDERHLNQHWSVSVGITGKPEPGQTLALAVYPRYEIETASAPREGLRLRPAGTIGVSPSVVTVEGGRRPDTLVGEFYLCNNDRSRHGYLLTVLPAGDLPDGRQLSPSGGWSWVADGMSVHVCRPTRRGPASAFSTRRWPTFWLGPHRYVAVPVEVRLHPGRIVPGGGAEAIVLAERDDGETAFVRVRVPRLQSEVGGAP